MTAPNAEYVRPIFSSPTECENCGELGGVFIYEGHNLCCECMSEFCSWLLNGGMKDKPGPFAHLFKPAHTDSSGGRVVTVCKYVAPDGVQCGFDDKAHRPYAGINRKQGVPSITTISELLDGGKSAAFGYAAAEIAAVLTVHGFDGMSDLKTEPCSGDHHVDPGLCEACKYVRGEHQRRWDVKAEYGSHIHHLAADWWAKKSIVTDEVTDPVMNQLEQFYKDYEPEIELAEFTLLYDKERQRYRGQGDTLGVLNCPSCSAAELKLAGAPEGSKLAFPPRCRWIWDNKTGRYWPKEQTLQLSAQRFSTHITDWSTGEERIAQKMTPVAHAGVLLVDAEGYRLVELPATQEAFNNFLRLRDAWEWMKQMRKWEKDHPLPDAQVFEEEPTE